MDKKILPELNKAVIEKMRVSGYREQTVKVFGYRFNEFLKYAEEQGEKYYSEELAERYLKEKYNFPSPEINTRPPNMTYTAVRALRKLGDYQLYGAFRRKRQSIYDNAWAMEDMHIIEAFINKMSKTDTAENTKKRALFDVQQFYDFIRIKGLTKISDITSEIMGSYTLSVQGDTLRYAKTKMATLKNYFRYLYQNGFIDRDFSGSVPKVIAPRNKTIPAIWTNDDVEKLLRVIDRASPIGKRDYAIFMLVSILGIRASDVNGLLLSQLNWQRKEINTTQQKTGKINVSPMTDEVGWAIIDYLRFARPKSDLPQVFLTLNAPYTALASTTAITRLKKYMQKAGLHETQGDIAKGMHSLRHSFARKLLDENIELDLLADIMGHTKIKSSSHTSKLMLMV
jgi:site-specific recombinase XerD